MCGIAGMIKLSTGETVSESELLKLGEPIMHRGPDDQGMFIDRNVGLIHKRLSIIDLNTGRQPIFNEDRTVVVIFNGEIYNFRELRGELEGLGHRFSTNSDTEVIVHAYEEYGVECLRRLKGMFAFALYDVTRSQLLLARDRLGEKPLKYYFDGSRMIFSSELKSILAMEGVDREIDPDALSAYFSFLCVPAPLTIFKKIRKLPPGSYLLYQGGRLIEEKYWEIGYKPGKTIKSEGEYVDEIDAMLRKTVQACMISDVPLGVFLSGGIDSSLITSYLAEASPVPVRTFSVGFGDSINELPYAKAVADMYATDHTVINVNADVAGVIRDLVWYYEEPYADSSAVPTYLISREARKYVTVILTGDGGDELFGGYSGYSDLPRIIMLNETRNPLFLYALKALYRLERASGLCFSSLHWWLAQRYPDKYYHYYLSRTIFSEQEKQRLLKGINTADTFEVLKNRLKSCIREQDQALVFDMNVYLPDDLLVKVDIASMASSLETRAPFLDYELAEEAFNIPLEVKIKGGVSKYLLKKLAERRLPREIIHRPKQGFGAPVDEWLRSDLKDTVLTVLLNRDHVVYRHIDYGYVEWLIDEFYSGHKDYAYRLWTILMFALWCEQYLPAPGRQDHPTGDEAY